MRWINITLLLLAGLMAGCAPVTPTPAELLGTVTAAPVVTATTAPSPTSAPTATTAPSPGTAPSPTPAPSSTAAAAPSRTPVPGNNQVGPEMNATPVTPDCKSFPGFPTCGAGLPLSGRLAVLDADGAHIKIYDFSTKLAMVVPAAAGVQKLAWVDKGNYLISYDGSGKPALAWANPVLSKTPPVPKLSPDGTPIFTAADGSTAWIDASFAFHVKPAQDGQEKVWPAEAAPSDKIHDLLGWVPGTTLLLAGYHFGANSMFINGDSLYTLDATSGKISQLNANLKLGGDFQWHPSLPGLMVFGDSKQAAVMGAARLAVLNVVSGALAHPIADANVASTYPSWTPDGKAILHAANIAGTTPAANDPFTLAAIYLTQYPAGTSRRLTQPASGARDDWPQLLADGAHFLYVRTSADGQTVELRLGALDGSMDSLVASGLTPPAPSPMGVRWESVMAYAP